MQEETQANEEGKCPKQCYEELYKHGVIDARINVVTQLMNVGSAICYTLGQAIFGFALAVTAALISIFVSLSRLIGK